MLTMDQNFSMLFLNKKTSMMAMIFEMARTLLYYTPAQQIIRDRVLAPEYNMTDNVS